MKTTLQRHSFDDFYAHVTQTGPQLEEISGDLYALESMISLAYDIEDLKLYHTHCRRLEATIYTLHEKIGAWRHGVARRRTAFQSNEYNAQALRLDEALMLVEGYISTLCRCEEKIMQLQQLIHDQKSVFVAATHAMGKKAKSSVDKIADKEIGWV